MTKPLRLGVAGLGVVGSGLTRLLRRQGDAIAERAGRALALDGLQRAPQPRRTARARRRALLRRRGEAGRRGRHRRVRRTDRRGGRGRLRGGQGGARRAACRSSPPTRRCSPRTGSSSRRCRRRMARRCFTRRRSAAAFRSSRRCARASPATRSAGSPAFSTAPATTFCRAWRRRRLPFDVCLADAQRLGYAEADPTFDVGGFDTAHKLAILASLAFGSKIDAAAVSVEGIESITLADLAAADELGFRIKLLGVAERTPHGVEQRVHPTMVDKCAPLAQTMGVLNAVSIDGDAIGELTLVGPGAGGDATASAVAADLVDIARGTAPADVRTSRRVAASTPTACRCSATRAAITCGSRSSTGPARWARSRRASASA